MKTNHLYHGDCLEVMKKFEDNSIDLIVTDPPYGYDFMGKDWDKIVMGVEYWKECLRVLKSGAFAFVMSAPRQDVLSRAIVNLQDAGFETGFTSLYHTYASGFPKASNIGKMVDKRLGVDRDVVGKDKAGTGLGLMDKQSTIGGEFDVTKGNSPLEGSYGGFQPKPSLECILTCRKPLTNRAELTIMISQLIKLIDNLCLNVNSANKVSSLPKTVEEFIAQKYVTEKTVEEAITQAGKVAKQYVPMDMLKSILRTLVGTQFTNWSIEQRWNSILGVLLSQMSTFTIKTVTALTTELKTLNSLLLTTIQSCTTKEETKQNGEMLNVNIVENILVNALTRCLPKETSALKSAGLNFSTKEKEKENVETAIKNLDGEVGQLNENTAPLNAIGTSVVLVAMKPLSEKTYVDQAVKNKKGITWLDDARIPYESEDLEDRKQRDGKLFAREKAKICTNYQGRFPANLLCSDDVLNDGEVKKSGYMNQDIKGKKWNVYGQMYDRHVETIGDSGSFSRYFDLDKWAKEHVQWALTYPFALIAKESKGEKNKYLKGEAKEANYNEYRPNAPNTKGGDTPYAGTNRNATMINNHPTVKPYKLMCYLITLGSREGDTVLDPFMGSGTSCLSAKKMNRKYIGIELEEEYFNISKERVENEPDTLL